MDHLDQDSLESAFEIFDDLCRPRMARRLLWPPLEEEETMRTMQESGFLGWVAVIAVLAGCAGGSDEPATGDDQEIKAKPKLEECQALDKRVDSCLDELGSIGGSLEDCIDVTARWPTACCKAYGAKFNYCR